MSVNDDDDDDDDDDDNPTRKQGGLPTGCQLVKGVRGLVSK